MSEDKSNEQNEYEQRLRRRLKILQKTLEEGKLFFAEGLKVKDSLLSVRVGSDGEVDLDTVDASVRAMALATEALHDREELKKVASLSDIQNSYFEFIELNFGPYYKIMVERNLTPNDAGQALSQNTESIESLTNNLTEFLDHLNNFWSEVGEIAHIHVEDMYSNIKGVFGGDLFPTHDENIASKCGLYTDTIVLPDPFLRSQHIFSHLSPKDKAYYLIKHGMNILQYKELACADVGKPIVVILPDRAQLEREEKEFFLTLGKKDSLLHAGKIFDRDFGSFDELIHFTNELDTVDKAIAEIKDKSRVLFDTNWQGDISSQINQAIAEDIYKPFGKNPGNLLAMQALGRMSVSNEILFRSRQLNGIPILEVPTSWQYFVWKLENDAELAERELSSENLHVLKGLNDLADSDMQWLGNIPTEALIEIRKDGALDEIRNLIGQGVNELIEINPSNFHRSRDQIFDNFSEAFAQHQKNLDHLRQKKWRFAGQDIGSWVVAGSIDIAAAITGTPIAGLASIVASQLTDAPKLKDIPQSIKDLAEENNKLKKSPVGMLFSIKKNNS